MVIEPLVPKHMKVALDHRCIKMGHWNLFETRIPKKSNRKQSRAERVLRQTSSQFKRWATRTCHFVQVVQMTLSHSCVFSYVPCETWNKQSHPMHGRLATNCSVCGLNLLHILDPILDSRALTTTFWIAPCHDWSICQDRSKRPFALLGLQSCHHHHLGVRMPGVQFHDIQDTRGQMLSLLLLLVPPELQWLYLHLEDLLPATHLQDPSRCAEKTSALALNCLTLELCSKTSFGCDRSATLWWLLTWSRNVSKPRPARSEPHDRFRSGNLKDAIPTIQIYLDLFWWYSHNFIQGIEWGWSLLVASFLWLQIPCWWLRARSHVHLATSNPLLVQLSCVCACVSNSHTHGFIPTDCCAKLNGVFKRIKKNGGDSRIELAFNLPTFSLESIPFINQGERSQQHLSSTQEHTRELDPCPHRTGLVAAAPNYQSQLVG